MYSARKDEMCTRSERSGKGLEERGMSGMLHWEFLVVLWDFLELIASR